MFKFFPLFLNITDKKCLIIGGGEAAYRKAVLFLEYGCGVTCIAAEAGKEIEILSTERKIILMSKSFEDNDISDFDFVVTATGKRDVALSVREKCKENKAILISADFPEISGAITPAIINKGEFSLAMSTNAKAPFYVKHLKEKMLGVLPENLDVILELAAAMRKEIKGFPRSIQHRLYTEFNSIDWDNIINVLGIESAGVLFRELIKSKNEKK